MSCVVFQKLLLRKRLGIESRFPTRIRPTGGTNEGSVPRAPRCFWELWSSRNLAIGSLFGGRSLARSHESPPFPCVKRKSHKGGSAPLGRPRGSNIKIPTVRNLRTTGYHKCHKCHEFHRISHCDGSTRCRIQSRQTRPRREAGRLALVQLSPLRIDPRSQNRDLDGIRTKASAIL